MAKDRASQKPTTGLILAIVVVFCIMMFMVSRTYPAGPAGKITTTVIPVPKPPAPAPAPHRLPMIPIPVRTWPSQFHPEPNHPHNPCNKVFPDDQNARAQCKTAVSTCHASAVAANNKHPYEAMQDVQDCITEVVKIDPKAVAAGLHHLHPHTSCIPPHLAMHKKKAFEEISNTLNALPKAVDWAREVAVGMPTCGSSLAPHFASGPACA